MSEPTIYRWRDDKGVESFATKLEDVPDAYRAQAQVYTPPELSILPEADGSDTLTVAGEKLQKVLSPKRLESKENADTATLAAPPAAGAAPLVDKRDAKRGESRLDFPRLSQPGPGPTRSPATSPAFLRGVDLPSAGFGFLCALALMALWRTARSRMGAALKVAMILTVVVLLGGGYIAVVRRAAGLSSGPLASPQDVIDDAHKVTESMNKRMKTQTQILNSIEERAP